MDVPPGQDEHCFLQPLLQLSNNLFVDVGEEDLVATVREINQHKALVLVVADLGGLDHADEGGNPFALLVEMIDGVKQETAHLLFKMVEGLCDDASTAPLAVRFFS